MFLSYAHESPEHREVVRQLYVLLRQNGIDAHWDGVAEQQPQDWAQWTADQIRKADHVLVIGSTAYRERAEGRAAATVGRGVQWEARLIRDEFYAWPNRLGKFIPVVLPGQSVDGIPDFFTPKSSTVYTISELTVAGSERLLRFLLDQPEERTPDLGPVPVFPVAPPAGVDAPPGSARPWPDFSTLPPAVRSLLRAQVNLAEDMPYQLPGDQTPSLADVYVRQDLGADLEPQDQPRPEPDIDRNGMRVVSKAEPVAPPVLRPRARAVRDVLNSEQHLLVKGGPGQGKSTLTLRLAADVAIRWMDGGDDPLAEPVVPLRIPARELAAHRDKAFPDALVAAVAAEYGSPVDANDLHERVEGCRWLLLVDALDEVADAAERSRLVRVLSNEISNPESPYRVVVTSRPVDGAELVPLVRAGVFGTELQPFDDAALTRFIGKWFADEPARAERFLREAGEARLDDLVRVPLLATIGAILFEERPDHPLPDNQYDLYEMYLRFLRAEDKVPIGPSDDHGRALLEHLGKVRLESDELLITAARAWAAANTPSLRPDDLVNHIKAVGPLVARKGDLQFLHHSFAEHLAASGAARVLPERFDPTEREFALLVHTASERGGRQAGRVLLHYTRMRPAEADRLIVHLNDGIASQHRLAAELIAEGAPVGPEALEAFSQTVHEWGMTSHRESLEILRKAGRATHREELPRRLAGLMRDPRAPVMSRLEVAAALAAQPLSADHEEALAVLREMAEDELVETRVGAAQVLARCGPAEREFAERVLRAVLEDADPYYADRDAAVALATFGGEAKDLAVTVLLGLLEEREESNHGLVETAARLVEIGVEFHWLSAAVFLAVLDDPVHDHYAIQGAAFGLVSLRPEFAEQVATALTTRIVNRRNRVTQRTWLAGVLGGLGPQHRAAAAQHVVDMLETPGLDWHERRACAESLTRFGDEFRGRGVAELRAIIADSTADARAVLWSARDLANVDSSFHAEAAEVLWRLCSRWRHTPLERAWALGVLARLDEPRQADAIRELRVMTAAHNGNPAARCAAAEELASLRPEFHPEVIANLRDILARRPEPDTAIAAGAQLLTLVDAKHLELSDWRAVLWPGDGEVPLHAFYVVDAGPSDNGDAMRLIENASGSLVSSRARISALRALAEFGTKRFDRLQVNILVDMVSSGELADDDHHYVIDALSRTSVARRADIATAFLRVVRASLVAASTTWAAIRVLIALGRESEPEVIAALKALSAWGLMRVEAATALARIRPEEAARVARTLLSAPDVFETVQWRTAVLELNNLGVDVVPGLRAAARNRDLTCASRAQAASVLHVLRPDLAAEALPELQRLADDDRWAFWWRSDAQMKLVAWGERDLDEVLACHRAVFEDVEQTVGNRLRAAELLVKYDSTTAPDALATLLAFCADRATTPAERMTCVSWLHAVLPASTREVELVAASVAADPASDPATRRKAVNWMTGTARLTAERALLTDYAIPLEHRLRADDHWKSAPRVKEVAAVLWDVLTGPETSPADRTAAAGALLRLSPDTASRASELLAELAALPVTSLAVLARWQSAQFNPDRWQAVHDEAVLATVDEDLPVRDRYRALMLLHFINPVVPEQVHGFARELVRDPKSGLTRLRVHYLLRHVDGLDSIRAIRDDEGAPAIRRCAASLWLLDVDSADRFESIRVLEAIAVDSAVRPGLRVLAATEQQGVGRQTAAKVLRAVAEGEKVSAATRAEAARRLGELMPGLRHEAVRLLRDIAGEWRLGPLQRRQVLVALGVFESGEAVAELRDMAEDRTLGAVVRVRCAEAMAGLRTDARESAALVVREVARDQSVPRHVRARAARDLARWSALCRDEARSLLTGELRSITGHALVEWCERTRRAGF
ncbi:MAG: TIR domain-containing protein [Saccharothrix sp.]|nr:TIR domain-containing protein [Saccharothrix sp.]